MAYYGITLISHITAIKSLYVKQFVFIRLNFTLIKTCFTDDSKCKYFFKRGSVEPSNTDHFLLAIIGNFRNRWQRLAQILCT
jgi:hypothetical protein